MGNNSSYEKNSKSAPKINILSDSDASSTPVNTDKVKRKHLSKLSTPNLSTADDNSSSSSRLSPLANRRNRAQTETLVNSLLRKHIHKKSERRQSLSSNANNNNNNSSNLNTTSVTPTSGNSSRSSSSSVLNIIGTLKSKKKTHKNSKADLNDDFSNISIDSNNNTINSNSNNNNNNNNRVNNKVINKRPKVLTPPLRRNLIILNQTRQASLDIDKVMLKPKTNQIYDDYYISKQVLGVGISGKVLECIQKKTNQKYALKTLKDTPKARREIDLQYRACNGCQNIVQIVDVYENVFNTQRVLLIVMEAMVGGELFGKISERNKPFTEQEVAKIMFQICTAVQHLHGMGIAHRDLKPENLLLSTNDDNAVIKLTDFGFAKEINMGLMTPCYTPYYVAPEVLGSEKYDSACDIWSLGVIMYILCCGYPPFYSTHGQPISPGMKKKIRAGEYTFPDAEWKNVSQEAKDLIRKMLDVNPEKRINIQEVFSSNWISRYHSVPQTPLASVDILKEEGIEQWQEIQSNFGRTLDEMRINWESKVKIKDIGVSNNSLFERRTKKNKVNETIASGATSSSSSSTATSAASTANEATTPKKASDSTVPNSNLKVDNKQLIIEDLSRESSMVETTTPTNSRPSSPKRMTH